MPLYPFQQTGVDFLTNTPRCILADEPGLGKTVQALKACENIGAERVLIVCPNTVKEVWAREIAKWVSGTVFLVEGTGKKRGEILAGSQTYTVINYEALRTHALFEENDNKKKVFKKLLPELNQTWDVIILDEAHRIANRKAQVSKVIRALIKKSRRIYILTGTPILNKADDLWSLLNSVDPKKYKSYWKFAQQYCDISYNGYGYDVKSITDPLDIRVAKLRLELAPIMLRRLKKEVFPEMPPKLTQQIWVTLDGEQKAVYRQMEKDMLARFDGKVVFSPIVIAQITRLKQIAIDPYLMLPGFSRLDGAKISAFLDILADTEPKKIVVFSQFVTALDRLGNVLKDLSVPFAKLTGDMTGKSRQAEIDRFSGDPGCRVFLCSTKAGGVGLTLTEASICVFLDKLWTPALNTQASDRLHRIGQTETVTVYELLAQSTVEEDIEDLLSHKQDISDSSIELLEKVRLRNASYRSKVQD